MSEPETVDLAHLAQEVIALVAPLIIDAAMFDLDEKERPHPMDLAATLMAEGLTIAGRTDLDERGIDTELALARQARLEGKPLAAAMSLVRVALRAHEIGDGPMIGRAWLQAVATIQSAAA